MQMWMKRLAMAAFALLAAVVLAFGAHTAYATATISLCDPGTPGYVGECPPLAEDTCTPACQSAYGTWSLGNGCAGGCCICAQR
jgi:hypothetical protein